MFKLRPVYIVGDPTCIIDIFERDNCQQNIEKIKAGSYF